MINICGKSVGTNTLVVFSRLNLNIPGGGKPLLGKSSIVHNLSDVICRGRIGVGRKDKLFSVLDTIQVGCKVVVICKSRQNRCVSGKSRHNLGLGIRIENSSVGTCKNVSPVIGFKRYITTSRFDFIFKQSRQSVLQIDVGA